MVPCSFREHPPPSPCRLGPNPSHSFMLKRPKTKERKKERNEMKKEVLSCVSGHPVSSGFMSTAASHFPHILGKGHMPGAKNNRASHLDLGV